MSKPTLATVWLDGCSGCHMSFLDMDERLLELAERADLVYSPLVDAKEYPDDVDVCLVEGAVVSEDDLHKIRMVRERTRTLVSFGDCAVTANVPRCATRSAPRPLLERAYVENVDAQPRHPARRSCRRCCRWPGRSTVVTVDVFLPGLPAVGRPHLLRADRPARGPRRPTRTGARFGR